MSAKEGGLNTAKNMSELIEIGPVLIVLRVHQCAQNGLSFLLHFFEGGGQEVDRGHRVQHSFLLIVCLFKCIYILLELASVYSCMLKEDFRSLLVFDIFISTIFLHLPTFICRSDTVSVITLLFWWQWCSV